MSDRDPGKCVHPGWRHPETRHELEELLDDEDREVHVFDHDGDFVFQANSYDGNDVNYHYSSSPIRNNANRNNTCWWNFLIPDLVSETEVEAALASIRASVPERPGLVTHHDQAVNHIARILGAYSAFNVERSATGENVLALHDPDTGESYLVAIARQ